MNSTIAVRKSEQGFTLVELAIVMIIIGLLLGGLLKGQELITNARVTSTVAGLKNIDVATTSFRDKYNGMPGDILTPGARIANCAVAPCDNTAGPPNANGLVDVGGGFAGVPTNEALAFFPQLAAANLISGIQQGANIWGRNFPEAPIAGGYHVSFLPGAAAPPSSSGIVAANFRAGHYLALHNAPAGGVGATLATGTAITPNQAFRIDSKLDDGNPSTGSILGAGAAVGVAGCASAAPGVYNEAIDQPICNLYIRIQQ